MKQLIVILLTLSLILPSCKFIREKGWFGKGKDTQELHQIRVDSIRVADSIKQAQTAEIERIRLQILADSVARAEEEQRILNTQFRFHIIVGSFITPEYAADHAAYYTNMGYETKIYPEVEGFDLVSAMDLDDLSKAWVLLERFRDTVEIDAWLYIYPE